MNPHFQILFSRPREFESRFGLMERALIQEFAESLTPTLRIVPHLYDLPPEASIWGELAASQSNLVVLCALYPRAAYWVLRAHGVNGRWIRTASWLPEEDLESSEGADDAEFSRRRNAEAKAERGVWCFDLRQFSSPDPLLAEIRRVLQAEDREEKPQLEPKAKHSPETSRQDRIAASVQGQELSASLLAESPSYGSVFLESRHLRPRWYPVIDYDRCQNCLQCLNFCLFGVFQLDGQGRLTVAVPDACRDGCPACARLCPRGAIIFPMYDDPAISGGNGFEGGVIHGDRLPVLGSGLAGGSLPDAIGHGLAGRPGTDPASEGGASRRQADISSEKLSSSVTSTGFGRSAEESLHQRGKYGFSGTDADRGGESQGAAEAEKGGGPGTDARSSRASADDLARYIREIESWSGE